MSRASLFGPLRPASTGRRNRRRPPCGLEALERRELLAADYLHALTSRPGVPDGAFGLGNALAVGESYHAAGHLFDGHKPTDGFLGEVQVHDAGTGALLRTIANPHPDDIYTFGHTIAIAGNLLAIGGIGRGEPHYNDGEGPPPVGPFSDFTGRAYLYDADTGDLIHAFETEQAPGSPYPFVQDGFGTAVAVSDDYVVVSAPGWHIDDSSLGGLRPTFEDPGRVYIFSTTTGGLLRVVQNPEPSISEGFGFKISLSGDRLLVASPFDDNDGEVSGAAYLFDIATGDLLRSFDNPDAGPDALFGGFAAIAGDMVVLGGQVFVGGEARNKTYIYDAADGSLLRTIVDDSSIPFAAAATSSSLLISTSSMPFQVFDPTRPIAFIHDLATGALVDSVLPPPSATTWFYSAHAASGDRLLISNYIDGSLDPGEVVPESEVWVYAIGAATPVNPPTDITLSGTSVAENSPVGTIVADLEAADLDPGETFTFTLLDNAGGRFLIVGDLLVVNTGAILDHEATPQLNVTIRVTDSDGASYTKTFTIQVTDADEPITDLSLLDLRVVERSPDGALVGAIDNPHPTAYDGFGNVAATPTRVLAASSNAPAAYILDAATLAVVHTLQIPSTSATYSVSLAINAQYAVVGVPFDDFLGPAAGAVHVYDVATGALIRTIHGASPAQFTFGASVALSGDRLVVGTTSANNRVFIYDVPTGTLMMTLQAPFTSGNGFGASVAIDGDRIAVGHAGSNTGFVHLYNAATGAFISTIANPGPAMGDFFGDVIAISGGRILVGAQGDDTVGENAGAAYLFDMATGALLHTFLPDGPGATHGSFGAALGFIPGRIAIGSNSRSGVRLYDSTTYGLIRDLPDVHFGEEAFGVSLAFGGSRLYVGDRATRGVVESGEIQVFDATTGDLKPSILVVDPEGSGPYTFTLLDDAGGRFAIVGDQLVVADGAAIDHGAAASHVITVRVTDAEGQTFVKSFTIKVIAAPQPPTGLAFSSVPAPESTRRVIHNLDPAPGRTFGQRIAASGDRILTVESHPTLPGRALVIDATTGETGAILAHPSPVPVLSFVDGAFGSTVALDGDFAIVAASYDVAGGHAGAGRVFVFNATTGAFLHALQSPTPVPFGRFGWVVAASGGRIAVTEVVEGAGQGVGAVYLFDAASGALVETVANPLPDPGDQFGIALALEGDSLLIGANGEDVVGADGGIVYLYMLDPTTSAATLVHTWGDPTPAPGAEIGIQVALVGGLAAVAETKATVGGVATAGVVHLFNVATGAFVRTIANPVPAETDYFGRTLTAIGNHLVVGISNAFAGNDTSGRVYVFDVRTGALTATLDNPSPAPGDRFGAGIAAAAGRLVVSAPGDDSDGADSGLIHVLDAPFGRQVGVLIAIDPDQGETFTYQLLDDAGGRFTIVGDRLEVADATLLDFETASTHSITVLVTDSDGATLSQSLTISVSPRGEAPRDIAFLTPALLENAPNGTIAATLTAIDPDFAGPVVYTLLDDAGGRFAVVGSAIVVANGALLDYEAAASYRILVRATDAGGHSVTEARTITLVDVPDEFDFGDLPNSFGTALAGNGARHAVTAGLRLGAGVTIEADAAPSVAADTDAGDDGVTAPFLLIPGLTATFTVTASAPGRLDAFIDFDGDGTFDADERVTPAGGLLLAAGANSVTIAVPATAVGGAAGARFRLSSAGGLTPIGTAADGEVEDHRVTIAAVSPYSTTVVPDPDAPGLNLLLVRGADGPESILVQAVAGMLRTRINGVLQPAAPANVSRIVILGGAGNDRIRIVGTAIPAEVHGGAGDDVIQGSTAGLTYMFGGEGNDRLSGRGVLSGGPGADVIRGYGARNVLLGGGGADRFPGARASRGDLVVREATPHDSDIPALRAILAERARWAPARARLRRADVATIRGLQAQRRLSSPIAAVPPGLRRLTASR